MRFITHYLISFDCGDVKRGHDLNVLLSGYCFHQQYSLFEGELTPSQFSELRQKLVKIVDKKKDNVLVYPLDKGNIFSKQVIGKLKYPIKRIF